MGFLVRVAILLLTVYWSKAAIDNSGTEFILCYMDNEITGAAYDMEMYVTTSSNNVAYINVTAPLHDPSWIVQVSVSRGSIATVTLPASLRGTGTGKDGLGVRVWATEEVTVYSVNQQRFSTDAFIAFPIDSLGSDYIAVTWEGVAEIMVAAVADGTNVTFKFPSNYTTGDVTYNGTTYYGGDSLSVTLQLYETFHVYSQYGDLSGTKISANKPFTAFSGNLKVPVIDTGTKTTSDHLVEQLVPVQAWGTEFVTFTTPDRSLGEFLRIVAAEDDTLYRFNATTYSLNATEYHTHNVPSGSYFYVTSNKGICIAVIAKTIGFSSTGDGPNGGDPAMSFVVPVALYVSDYTFSTVQATTGQFTNYLIVVSNINYTADIILDNTPAVGDWVPVTGSSEYVAAVLNVSDGAHSVYNTDPTKGFLGMAMGNAQFNSYAYASGMRLAPINLPCSPGMTTAGDGEDNDCDGAIDEEADNGIDDDGDGLVDEDLALGARVDGQWSAWGNWTSCSASCDGYSGSQSRERYCDSPAPANNGLYCPGNNTESQNCTSSLPCPVDGQWSAWGNWTSCSETCGGYSGSQSRERYCDSPAPANNGLSCPGNNTESQNCTSSMPCPVDGQWSAWGNWTSCSETCGSYSGAQSRERYCDSPAPANNGLSCPGNNAESQNCSSSLPCPVDGQWSAWGNWTSCSETCGGYSGAQSRERYCESPVPANNGLSCPGNNTESQNCTSSLPCPVNGGWGPWGNWTVCSVTCGAGVRLRHRSCDAPLPQYGGDGCVGTDSQSTTCGVNSCFPSFYGNVLLGCSAPTEFGCASGSVQCIDLAFRCDGTADCDDSSDESTFFTGCVPAPCGRSSADRPRRQLTRVFVPCVTAAILSLMMMMAY